MCGIAGILWSAARGLEAGTIVDRMVHSIEHRGPDSDGRVSTSFCEVGFRRLSIIDLSSGDQPVLNEDGSVQCFLNGEIYNYLQLRKDLEARGHQFHTRSDAEVLPHLYEEFGTDMFRHLNGMFVICLIDVPNRQIVLARDQFGVKQLYFSGTSDGVVFASEMKAILASGLVKPEMDEANVLSYLTLFYCPEPETLVRGVRKLSPGCWTKLKPGREPEIHRYYEIPVRPATVDIGLAEAADRTRELLWQSVELQLQADVPVGISLSGGVDSSALACAAVNRRRATSYPLALTIHWPDTPPDELTSAKDLCQHLNLPQEVLEIPVTSLLDELPLLGWMSDEPVADPAIYSQFCVARQASNHVKVLLSGAGGDELFGGYGSYTLPRRYAVYNALPQVVRERLRPLVTGKWMSGDSLSAAKSYRQSRFGWHRYTKSNLAEDEQVEIAKGLPNSRDPFVNFETLFRRYRGYDPANQQMVVDFRTYLPEQILTMMDRATMAASIEGRVPFLDPALVDFAFSLSDAIKLGTPTDGKRVLKRAISADVSQSVLKRKKAGMPSPFVPFLVKHIDAVRAILLSEDSYVRSLLPEEWLGRITSDPTVAGANFRSLYATLTLEVWHKLFIREKFYGRPEMTAADLFKIPAQALAA
jgi:asparagine synthase (glutamine-hydrolysing)